MSDVRGGGKAPPLEGRRGGGRSRGGGLAARFAGKDHRSYRRSCRSSNTQDLHRVSMSGKPQVELIENSRHREQEMSSLTWIQLLSEVACTLNSRMFSNRMSNIAVVPTFGSEEPQT
jgi:hypothetical protein